MRASAGDGVAAARCSRSGLTNRFCTQCDRVRSAGWRTTAELRKKSGFLTYEWGWVMEARNGGRYSIDTFVCGRVDLHEYAGSADAVPLLPVGWNRYRPFCPATAGKQHGMYGGR